MKKLYLLLSILVTGGLYAMDPGADGDPAREAITALNPGCQTISLIFQNGPVTVDHDVYARILRVMKIDQVQFNHALTHVSSAGFMALNDTVDAIEALDNDALQEIYTGYMETGNHEKFCELIMAASHLCVGEIIESAFEFFKENFETMITNDDETFCVKMLEFRKNRWTGCVRALQFNDDVSPEICDITKLENGGIPLFVATECGKPGIVRTLLASGVAVDQRDADDQSTALMKAAGNGYVDIVQALCNAGAQKDLKDANGWTALIYAAENGHDTVIQVLRAAGAHVDIRDNGGMTALEHAAFEGHKDAFIALGGEASQMNADRREVMNRKRRGIAGFVPPTPPTPPAPYTFPNPKPPVPADPAPKVDNGSNPMPDVEVKKSTSWWTPGNIILAITAVVIGYKLIESYNAPKQSPSRKGVRVR